MAAGPVRGQQEGVPLSLQVEIDGEAVASLLSGLVSEMQELAATRGSTHCIREEVVSLIYRELLDFGENVFEFVSGPAARAGNHVLRFRISGAFQRHVATRTLNVFDVVRH